MYVYTLKRMNRWMNTCSLLAVVSMKNFECLSYYHGISIRVMNHFNIWLSFTSHGSRARATTACRPHERVRTTAAAERRVAARAMAGARPGARGTRLSAPWG